MDVGFYYMANAAGRLLGTLLSGLTYQVGGLALCLGTSALFVALSALGRRPAAPRGDGPGAGLRCGQPPRTAMPAPPAAATSTTAQGGVFHATSRTKHTSARARSPMSRTAPVKTGS